MASTSASSVQKSFTYDVFLSFRGEDTRKSFVDHLYHALYKSGIITYKDDEKIQKGERINEQLIRSIQDSRFYIIVFSKNYASSSWCLDELAEIMECQKMAEHTAYPVFYDVEPTEVRHQSGAVGEAFAKHVAKGKRALEDIDQEKEEDVGRWRNALKDAAGLAGWELKNTLDGHEARLIEDIIKEISQKLHFISLNIDDNLVGMETRVLNVISSFKLDSDDVHMIGIRGIGGGGKTTLARAIFHHISIRFESKSFVENVREGSKGSGLKKLQKQALQDVLNVQKLDIKSVHDGKNMMKKMMHGKKVLMVLDDVDHIEQLEALAKPNWFKPGSRIIITTRDQQVLVAHGVNIIHDVNLLSDKEAICLFSRYAFKRDIPNQGYEELSRRVVYYAAGLPLTIKVLGSHLCGRSELEWVDATNRLKNIPLKETLEKLELSYNGLENDQKEIFLDVICMLKGEKKKRAIRLLESCGFNAHIGLRVLEQKSLITISNSNRLRFHDHIEEMGRNIVRRSDPNEPSRHSRLWIKEEINDILVNESGTKATRSINMCFNGDVKTIMKGLRKMEELRLLCVLSPYRSFNDDEVSQYSPYLPDTLQSLIWLSYPFQSLPETFQANNLVNLEMRWSNIRELWNGGERKVLNKLRFLDLKNSKLRTLDLRSTPHLEVLDLEGCEDLVELQFPIECLNHNVLNHSGSKVSSINLGPAPHLERLNLKGCFNLRELQTPVGCLGNLVDFKLTNCLNFIKFEVKITHESANPGYVPTFNINVVYIMVCPVHPTNNLPLAGFHCLYDGSKTSSTGIFEKLISFGPCLCENREYILGIESIDLRKLSLSGSIPQNLWGLQRLEKLSLHDQQFQHLPDSICMLKHLKSLQLWYCSSLEQLPENIWEFGCLEELIILWCESLRDIPDSICKMKSLNLLNLKYCSSIMKLPEELGSLECLQKLAIEGTGIAGLPQSIYQLKGLCIYGSREKLESIGFTSILEDSGCVYVKL